MKTRVHTVEIRRCSAWSLAEAGLGGNGPNLCTISTVVYGSHQLRIIAMMMFLQRTWQEDIYASLYADSRNLERLLGHVGIVEH